MSYVTCNIPPHGWFGAGALAAHIVVLVEMASSSNSSLHKEETEPGHTGGQEVVVLPLHSTFE